MKISVQRVSKKPDLDARDEDYLREITMNTILLFRWIFQVSEEEKETFIGLVCSTVEEVFNNLDPDYTWKIECNTEESG